MYPLERREVPVAPRQWTFATRSRWRTRTTSATTCRTCSTSGGSTGRARPRGARERPGRGRAPRSEKRRDVAREREDGEQFQDVMTRPSPLLYLRKYSQPLLAKLSLDPMILTMSVCEREATNMRTDFIHSHFSFNLLCGRLLTGVGDPVPPVSAVISCQAQLLTLLPTGPEIF